MKPKASLRSFLSLAGSAVLAITAAQADILYWDGATPAGAPGGGDGTWNNTGSNTNWDTALTGGDVAWDNSSPYDIAIFGGAVGTVSLGSNIFVGGLRFDTNNYVINTGANTLNFAAANNFIGFSRVSAATITGDVGGSGNVSIGLVNPMVGTTLTPFTLTLNGTSAGGWSGTTTIGALSTLALADSNQALLNTTGGITLNGGGITLTNTAAQASLNRVNNSAAITSNGGTITYTNANTASTTYTETIGSTALTSGRLNLVLTNNVNATGASQTLTLSGLTRTGATNSSTVAFSGNALNTTTNRIAIGGASDGFVGPWATVGTAANAQTDYAFITDVGGTKYVTAANIGATAENSGSWVAGANVTLSGAATLTGTRTLNTLRYTGGAGALALGASTHNLETYGILNGGSGTLTISNTGTGALTTPTGGGFLYLTAGNNAITVSSRIADNGGAVSPVLAGNGNVTLSGTNDFTGSVMLNSGTLTAGADANLGITGWSAADIIINGTSTFAASSVTYGRGIQINNGAIFQFDGNNPIISGNVTGTGGIRVGVSGFGNQLTFNGTGNTFEGPILIAGTGITGQAYRASFNSLVDSASANGRIVFSSNSINHSNGSVFEYTGSNPLTLNNRVIEIASTGTTPTNGHQIRATGIGVMTINTDLLVNSTTAQLLSLGGGNTLGVNEFAGLISNGASSAISLRKVDAGQWDLTNTNNSYTGGTTINGGTLGFASGALGTTGTITLAAGTTLRWLTGNTQDISSRLSLSTGATTFHTGGNNVTFANTIGTGAGSLIKIGAGTLTLTGTNYTGTTTVNEGTLALDYTTVASKLPNAAALILGGGTLDLRNGASSHTEIVASTTLTANTGSYVTRSSGTSVLQMGTITNNTGTINFGAENIATTNNTNIVATGILGTWATVGGDWAINSTNGANGLITAYTGYTDVTRQSSGTKAIADGVNSNVRIIEGTDGSPAAITVTGTVAINTLNQSISGGTSAATISMGGQTLRTSGILMGPGAGTLTIGAAGGSAAVSGTLTPNSGGSLIFTNNSANDMVINSVLALNGTNTFFKTGTGTVVLAGDNTFNATLNIQDGIVKAGKNSTSTSVGPFGQASSSAVIFLANKATAGLDINGYDVFVKSLTGGGLLGGNVTLTAGKTLTIAGSAASENYAGTIQGAGNLKVETSSGQILSGLNTYTGVTTLAGNTTLIVNSLANGGSASGIGASTNAAANLVFAGTGTSGPRVRYNGATYAETDRRFTLSGNGGLDVGGAGSVNWTNTAAITHGVTTAKTLYFFGAGAGTGTLAAEITDSVGKTSITKGGAASTNTWILTNPDSSFTGDITFDTTTASAGTLAYASAGGTNPITFKQTTSTATLSYIGSTNKEMSGAITASTLTSGTITLDSSGTGAVNYSNTASLGSAASGNKNLILSGTSTGNNILAGQWVNNTGGAATLTKNGPGKWTLTNTNSYSGATLISAGTLQLGNGTSTGALTGTASITNNGVLIVNRNNVFTQATDLNGQAITGAGSFVQAGTGTTTLSASNTYTGTTNVTSGTLVINGSTSTSSAVTVGNTATLKGSGSIGGSVTIQSGGTLASGTSIESLTTGALTLEALATFDYEMNKDAAPAVAGDLTAVTGNLTLDLTNATILTLTDLGTGSWTVGEKLTLISYTGAWNGGLFNYGGTLNDGDIINFSGIDWEFDYNDTVAGTNFTGDLTGSSFVTMTAIPEPRAALLGGLGVLMLLRRRRA